MERPSRVQNRTLLDRGDMESVEDRSRGHLQPDNDCGNGAAVKTLRSQKPASSAATVDRIVIGVHLIVR